jgi:hypothetical protein
MSCSFMDRRTARGLVQARVGAVWDSPLRYQVCEGAGLNAFVYRALVDGAYLGECIGFGGVCANVEVTQIGSGQKKVQSTGRLVEFKHSETSQSR